MKTGQPEKSNAAKEKANASRWAKILGELEKNEKLITGGKDPTALWPEWVQKLGVQLGKMVLPVALSKGVINDEAALVGALLGHQKAIAEWLAENSDFKRIAAATKRKLTKKQQKDLEKLSVKWVSSLGQTHMRATLEAQAQPVAASSKFLKAYTKALDNKPRDQAASNVGNTAFGLYGVLFLSWRKVEQFRSVADLHKWLCGLFGKERIGDPKRLEQICRRIGLKFRKPGRPRKQKNSDTGKG